MYTSGGVIDEDDGGALVEDECSQQELKCSLRFGVKESQYWKESKLLIYLHGNTVMHIGSGRNSACAWMGSWDAEDHGWVRGQRGGRSCREVSKMSGVQDIMVQIK